MLNDFISTYYELQARKEAQHRERLDLSFDEIQAPAETIGRIEQMLASHLTREQTSEPGWFAIAGIKIIEGPSAVKNFAWLLREGRFIGTWNLDTGEILHWQLPQF